LKDVASNAPVVAREFHSHIVKWSLGDLLSSDRGQQQQQQYHQQQQQQGMEGGREGGGKKKVSFDPVPLRFRDPRHYLDIWQPLLLEETRCALGRDVEEGLKTAAAAAAAAGRQQQQQQQQGKKKGGGGNGIVGEVVRLALQQVGVDGEGDGLCTLTFSIQDDRRLEQQLRYAAGGGQEVFLLQPRGRMGGAGSSRSSSGGSGSLALLEEGEVEEEEGGGGGRVGGHQQQQQFQKQQQQQQQQQQQRYQNPFIQAASSPHAVAIFISTADAGDTSLFKFRVALSRTGPGAGGVVMKDFKVGSDWHGVGIGSLTTAAREFAALKEVLGFRLAPRLLQGGKEAKEGGGREGGRKSLANLVAVDGEGMIERWREIERWDAAASEPEGGGKQMEEAEKLLRGIKALRKLRVSQRLLAETRVGREVKALKKKYEKLGVDVIRDACGQLIQTWREQIELEKACYEGEVSQTVIAAGDGNSQSQGHSQEMEQQQKENSSRGRLSMSSSLAASALVGGGGGGGGGRKARGYGPGRGGRLWEGGQKPPNPRACL